MKKEETKTVRIRIGELGELRRKAEMWDEAGEAEARLAEGPLWKRVEVAAPMELGVTPLSLFPAKALALCAAYGRLQYAAENPKYAEGEGPAWCAKADADVTDGERDRAKALAVMFNGYTNVAVCAVAGAMAEAADDSSLAHACRHVAEAVEARLRAAEVALSAGDAYGALGMAQAAIFCGIPDGKAVRTASAVVWGMFPARQSRFA